MCFLLLVLLPWHKVQNLKSSKGFYGQPSGAPIMSHVQDNLWNSRMYMYGGHWAVLQIKSSSTQFGGRRPCC